MAEDELNDLVRNLEHSAIRDAGVKSQANDLRWKAAKAIESLRASLANAEDRFDASEARNEFLTSVIEAIEQAAKEAKELPK
jgi:hypothetical protein